MLTACQFEHKIEENTLVPLWQEQYHSDIGKFVINIEHELIDRGCNSYYFETFNIEWELQQRANTERALGDDVAFPFFHFEGQIDWIEAIDKWQ